MHVSVYVCECIMCVFDACICECACVFECVGLHVSVFLNVSCVYVSVVVCVHVCGSVYM